MIKQVINIERYWKVIVYYNVNYNFFKYIEEDLINLQIDNTVINEVHYMLKSKRAKGVTISNPAKYSSIILFNKHDSGKDYIDTIVHEAEHVKQAILKAYSVEDVGEKPAYTIGYIVRCMYDVIKDIINN